MVASNSVRPVTPHVRAFDKSAKATKVPRLHLPPLAKDEPISPPSAQSTTSGKTTGTNNPHLQHNNTAGTVPKEPRSRKSNRDTAETTGEWEIPFDDIRMGPRIGRGSFAEVMRGQWNGIDVAVKRYLWMKDNEYGNEELSLFGKELRLMKRLKHPSIVQFIGACTKGPNLCLVMEYCLGGSLDKKLRDQSTRITRDIVLQMAIEISQGMLYLHCQTPPVMHRDLKPANIFIEEGFHIKIGDLGLSTEVLQSRPMAECGTLQYMAPEILRGEQANEKVDVYSFGITLYEMIMRQTPYSDLSIPPMMAGLRAAYNGLRPSLEGCPFPEFIELIKSCWENDPLRRPDFHTILSALVSLKEKGSRGSRSR